MLDAIVCELLKPLHPFTTTAGPVYVDAEGDLFVDGYPLVPGNAPGIHEAEWRDELFWDCLPYADWSGTTPQPGTDGTPVVDP
jgi:hypothetical protein